MESFDFLYKIDNNLIGYSDKMHNKPTSTSFLFHTFRIIRIKDGMVDWKVGNQAITLKTGDIALFNNILPRKIIKIHNGQPLTYDLFGFSPSIISDPLISTLFYSNNVKVSMDNKDLEDIYFLLNELKSEIISEKKFKQKIVENLLHITLIKIARFADLSSSDVYNMKGPQLLISNATLYIQNNLSSDLTVSKLAKMCGYSSEHFSRIFKKYIGTSVNTYIVNSRIENVLRLIKYENYNVLNAAFSSGFNTSSGFYKAFKKHKKSSPSHYKSYYDDKI